MRSVIILQSDDITFHQSSECILGRRCVGYTGYHGGIRSSQICDFITKEKEPYLELAVFYSSWSCYPQHLPIHKVVCLGSDVQVKHWKSIVLFLRAWSSGMCYTGRFMYRTSMTGFPLFLSASSCLINPPFGPAPSSSVIIDKDPP